MIIIIAILALVSIFLITAGFVLYDIVLNSRGNKSRFLKALGKIDSSNQAEFDFVPADRINEERLWLKNGDTVYEDIFIKSDDGLKLHGYFVHQESNKWAILAHGYFGKPEEMDNAANHFYDRGYNVLLPSARGHGRSEGQYIGMGWHERLDYLRWIDWIINACSDAQILLFGQSMGGATVMMTSGENLPSNVKVIIEDCGYTSADSVFKYQMNHLFNNKAQPLIFLLTKSLNIVSKIKAGYRLSEASPIKQVAKSRTPMMLIHGSEDTFVPSFMIHELYARLNVPKELYVVEGAGHLQSASIAVEEYWKRVFGFIAKFVDK